MPLGDPDVKFVLAKIRNVMQKLFGLVMHRLTGNDPAHVRPQSAIARRMGITFHIGQLMMHTVSRYPSDWPAFERQRSKCGQYIFHPLRRFISAMRQQPVVAHSDAQASSNPPQDEEHSQGLPAKKEKCRNRADVERTQKNGRGPVNRLFKCFVVYQNAHWLVVLDLPLLLPDSKLSRGNSSLCNTCVIPPFALPSRK